MSGTEPTRDAVDPSKVVSVFFDPYGTETLPETETDASAKNLFEALSNPEAARLVNVIGVSVDKYLFSCKQAPLAPGAQTLISIGTSELSASGKETLESIATICEKELIRKNISPYFGEEKNNKLLLSILKYVLPSFSTVSKEDASKSVPGGIVTGLALVLTSPAARGSNSARTPTGREALKFGSGVLAVDKELRGVTSPHRCPPPIPHTVYVIDALGHCARKGGNKSLPKYGVVPTSDDTLSTDVEQDTAEIVEPSQLLREVASVADAAEAKFDSEDSDNEELAADPRARSFKRSETGVDHSEKITALGPKALHPFLRLIAELTRNMPGMLAVPSSRKFDGAGGNWSSTASIHAEQTLSHPCTTSRIVHSWAYRIRHGLLVGGWSQELLDAGLKLLGDDSTLSAMSSSSSYFTQQAAAKRERMLNEVRIHVRSSMEASQLVPKTSPLYPFRTAMTKILASLTKPRQLGGEALSAVDREKPKRLTQDVMDAALKPFFNGEQTKIRDVSARFRWTEELSTVAYKAWCTGVGASNLRRLSSAINALSSDNPLSLIVKTINAKLRTVCSGAGDSTTAERPSFLSHEELKPLIMDIYKNEIGKATNSSSISTSSSTSSSSSLLNINIRELTNGDMNEAFQYWGGSGRGTRNVRKMASSDASLVLRPLIVDIRRHLAYIRTSMKRIENPLLDETKAQLCQATLKALNEKVHAADPLTELSPEYGTWVTDWALQKDEAGGVKCLSGWFKRD